MPPRQPSEAEVRLWRMLVAACGTGTRATIEVGALALGVQRTRRQVHRYLRRWRRCGAIAVKRTGRASVYLVRSVPPWLRRDTAEGVPPSTTAPAPP